MTTLDELLHSMANVRHTERFAQSPRALPEPIPQTFEGDSPPRAPRDSIQPGLRQRLIPRKKKTSKHTRRISTIYRDSKISRKTGCLSSNRCYHCYLEPIAFLGQLDPHQKIRQRLRVSAVFSQSGAIYSKL